MDKIAQGAALVLAGMALGWTAFFSFVIAPQAYRDLDQGRAGRFVRNAMKNGHPAVAGLAFASALAGLAALSIAGASVMAVAGVLYLLARWTLAPRDDETPHGAKRRLTTARTVAAALTAMIMLVVLAGVVLIGLKV